ncbi:hypothetical protein INT45_001259 [Circinella minor]|uniref:Uncharacterized protein n=1 Tax=Circinella minor TaxID=1195481 RepID=A0A8H7RCK3_9FUNG|nr:hypothetical protein INT45_001259 [Circinella minor]
MRGKTKQCIWCNKPVFKAHIRQHEDNECEKNPYADPNNPIEPPTKKQRRSVGRTSLPSHAVPESNITTSVFSYSNVSAELNTNSSITNNNLAADVNNDNYSFDQNYDDDVYDDGVFDYGDSNMMASSPEPSIIHDAQALARSFTPIQLETSMDHDEESFTSFNEDIDNDMMDDDTIDVIDNDDNSEVSAAIDEMQPSVSITTN